MKAFVKGPSTLTNGRVVEQVTAQHQVEGAVALLAVALAAAAEQRRDVSGVAPAQAARLAPPLRPLTQPRVPGAPFPYSIS
jgi:hypothetical protein|eukprot:COSAG01_NODE_2385_length_7787_cov_62.523023_10_plen_81_part_00